MRFSELVKFISRRDEYFYNIMNYARLATIRDLIALSIVVFVPYLILCKFYSWGYLLLGFGGVYLFIACLLHKLRFNRYLSREEAYYVNRVLADYGEIVRVRFDWTSRLGVIKLEDKYNTRLRLGKYYVPKGSTVRAERIYQLRGGYRLLRYRYKLVK